MTQPFGNPQGPLSFSAFSSAGAETGVEVVGFSTSVFFSVAANGFEVFAVFPLVAVAAAAVAAAGAVTASCAAAR